jgi:hypothetical protein
MRRCLLDLIPGQAPANVHRFAGTTGPGHEMPGEEISDVAGSQEAGWDEDPSSAFAAVSRDGRHRNSHTAAPGGLWHEEDLIEWVSHYGDGSREERTLARHQPLLALRSPAPFYASTGNDLLKFRFVFTEFSATGETRRKRPCVVEA